MQDTGKTLSQAQTCEDKLCLLDLRYILMFLLAIYSSEENIIPDRVFWEWTPDSHVSSGISPCTHRIPGCDCAECVAVST